MDGKTAIDKIREQEHQWLYEYYGQLVGFKIVDFRVEEDEEGTPWPIFTMRHPLGKRADGTTAWETIDVVVSCDQEGNREGFLFLEDTKHPRYAEDK